MFLMLTYAEDSKRLYILRSWLTDPRPQRYLGQLCDSQAVIEIVLLFYEARKLHDKTVTQVSLFSPFTQLKA